MRAALALGAVLLAAAAAALVASSWWGREGSAGRPLVLAAASLTEVLPRIEPDASYSFASSSALADTAVASSMCPRWACATAPTASR